VTDDTVIACSGHMFFSMGKLHVILLPLSMAWRIGGGGGVCKYTSAKDMHCYAEKHNAMHVMVTRRARLGNPFPLPPLRLVFFFEISKWVLKIGGVSVTYRVMCFFGARVGASGSRLTNSPSASNTISRTRIALFRRSGGKGGKKQKSEDVPSSRTLDVSGRSERCFRLPASVTFVTAAVVVQTLSDASAITVG